MNKPMRKNRDNLAETLKVVAMIFMFAGFLLLAFSGYVYATDSDSTPSILAGYVSIGNQNVSLPMVGGIMSIAIAAALFFFTLPPTSGVPRPPDGTRV